MADPSTSKRSPGTNRSRFSTTPNTVEGCGGLKRKLLCSPLQNQAVLSVVFRAFSCDFVRALPSSLSERARGFI